MLLMCLFSVQTIFAVDVPLKKGDTGYGTMRVTKPLSATSIPVTADLFGTDLIVDFSISVGTAYVSVVDATGNVVYLTTIDTYTNSEVIIDLDGSCTGNYRLIISYGTTQLSGSFQL